MFWDFTPELSITFILTVLGLSMLALCSSIFLAGQYCFASLIQKTCIIIFARM